MLPIIDQRYLALGGILKTTIILHMTLDPQVLFLMVFIMKQQKKSHLVVPLQTSSLVV